MDLEGYLRRRREMVNSFLERWMPGEEEFPPEMHRAMRYSLFAGGKRLRPILSLAAAEAVGGRVSDVLPLACALELIHTYSLIHDDLPAMDDDDLRRGKPTNHVVFGEALAILAGDGLLTEAFRLLSHPGHMKNVSPARRLRAVSEIARAAGPRGMVGGQAMDISSQGKKIDSSLLEYIHSHKTGSLMAASVSAGAIAGGGTVPQCRFLKKYGEKLGLAFQIVDDLLDVTGQVGKLGKAVGKDRSRGKVTYPGCYGIAGSRRQAEVLVRDAIDSLTSFDRRANPLREIARLVLTRKN